MVVAIASTLLGGDVATVLRLERVVVGAGTTRVVQGRGEPTLISVDELATLAAAGRELVTYRRATGRSGSPRAGTAGAAARPTG